MRNTVENCLHVDVRQWQRQGLLIPGHYFNCQWTREGETIGKIGVLVRDRDLVLDYRCRQDKWEDVTEPVKLVTTACNFGGHRYWLCCPSVGCGKRVAILYGGGTRFACRHCHNLNYQTQHEEPHTRLARKAHKLRAQLGFPYGFFNGYGKKPKGMHWSTFNRLAQKAEHTVDQCMIEARSRFKDYDGFG